MENRKVKYIVYVMNFIVTLWILAFIFSTANAGIESDMVSVFSYISVLLFPLAFLSFPIIGLYYFIHVRRNPYFGWKSKLFWNIMLIPFAIPMIFYWNKYVKPDQ